MQARNFNILLRNQFPKRWRHRTCWSHRKPYMINVHAKTVLLLSMSCNYLLCICVYICTLIDMNIYWNYITKRVVASRRDVSTYSRKSISEMKLCRGTWDDMTGPSVSGLKAFETSVLMLKVYMETSNWIIQRTSSLFPVVRIGASLKICIS